MSQKSTPQQHYLSNLQYAKAALYMNKCGSVFSS